MDYDVRTNPGKETGVRVSYAVVFHLLSKARSTQWSRDLMIKEIDEKINEYKICEKENCLNQMLNHMGGKWTSDPKTIKNRYDFTIGYKIKIIAHNGVASDNTAVL